MFDKGHEFFSGRDLSQMSKSDKEYLIRIECGATINYYDIRGLIYKFKSGDFSDPECGRVLIKDTVETILGEAINLKLITQEQYMTLLDNYDRIDANSYFKIKCQSHDNIYDIYTLIRRFKNKNFRDPVCGNLLDLLTVNTILSKALTLDLINKPKRDELLHSYDNVTIEEQNKLYTPKSKSKKFFNWL